MRTVAEESDCVTFGDLDAVTAVAASQHLCPCIKSLFTAEYTFVIYCNCMVMVIIYIFLFPKVRYIIPCHDCVALKNLHFAEMEA